MECGLAKYFLLEPKDLPQFLRSITQLPFNGYTVREVNHVFLIKDEEMLQVLKIMV